MSNPLRVFIAKFAPVDVQVALHRLPTERMVQMSQSMESAPLAGLMVEGKDL